MQLDLQPIDAAVDDETARAQRPRVLVVAPFYLPGTRSGGPVQTISGMIESLSSRFEFFVVTRDRDARDTAAYPGTQPGTWYKVGTARVLYCASISSAVLERAYLQVRPDVISLNSFQDRFTRVAVRMRKAGGFGTTPVILAPHGEFSPGALAIKRTKKALYRWTAKIAGLHDGLHWQVSTWRDKQELLDAAPARRLTVESIHEASNMCSPRVSSLPHVEKTAGSLRLGFLSRISEIKNLDFALERLRHLRGQVRVDIYGTLKQAYWEKCRRIADSLPRHCTVEYRGVLESVLVPDVLRQFHFFLLPTKGENFCHAAAESFINGTPVLLSDRTPWVQLNQVRAGFDIPLDRPDQWTTALQECIDMDQDTYTAYVNGAQEYGRRFAREKSIEQFCSMLNAVIATRH